MRRPGRKPLVVSKLPSIVSPQDAAVVRGAILKWFELNGRDFPWRRDGASVYHRILAEVLLQRTRAQTVAAFFDEFTRRFPRWQSIADATVEEIGELLKPIGLWRRRAASLSALARVIADRHGQFPTKRTEIEKLPGVGQYIANSVLLFSNGRPEPLLDVNMARVIERLFGPRRLADIRDDPYLQSVSRAIVRGKRAATVNWGILDLAASVCTVKNPRCGECPLRWTCRFARQLSEHPHDMISYSIPRR